MSLMGAYSKNDYLTREELRTLPVPEPQGPWHKPVDFGQFVDLVDDELNRAGLRVVSEEHYTLRKHQRHFGVLTVADMTGVLGGAGWTLMLGIKGSHDQSDGRGIVVGTHVGVCSNGMFHGDLGRFTTKQSTHIWDRLRDMVRKAVGRLHSVRDDEDARIADLKAIRLELQAGDVLLAEMYRQGAFSGSQLARALDQWYRPAFREHLAWGRTLWLLEQAVTQALKPTGHTPVQPTVLEDRTRRAFTVIDGFRQDVKREQS